jgi:hypothetical protein
MSETLNDIIDRLGKQNEVLNSRVAFFEASMFKQKQLLDSEIKNLSTEINTIKKADIKSTYDLDIEIKELKALLELKKPSLAKTLTDKDVNSLIDARVTESYITNKYRNK